MKTKLSFIIIIIILTASCVTQQPPGTKTSASKYNPSSYVLHPKFKVFHESETYSKLYLQLFTKELRYSSANKDRINQALIKVNYKITESIRSHDILDSAQTTINIKKITGQTSMISFFKIKHIDLENYFIEINLVDVYGNKKSQSYIYVNNSKDDNQQYYLSLKKKNQKPVFNEYLNRIDTFYIKHRKKDIKKMSVSFYKSNFRHAQKPYSTLSENLIKLKTDSAWKIPVKEGKAIFQSKLPGIYIIRADSTKIRGMLKVLFKDEYPIISQSYQLIDALQYIISEDEYKKLVDSENKKLSVDNFWIKASGNKEKARELLKIWYNRATYSNYYFTTYKEGWKTDRGMIYMVFGPPDDIYHFDDAEKWIYLNTKLDKKLDFIFIRQLNSFSNNDYTLMRNSKFEPMWSKAIKAWHSGQVYRY